MKEINNHLEKLEADIAVTKNVKFRFVDQVDEAESMKLRDSDGRSTLDVNALR